VRQNGFRSRRSAARCQPRVDKRPTVRFAAAGICSRANAARGRQQSRDSSRIRLRARYGYFRAASYGRLSFWPNNLQRLWQAFQQGFNSIAGFSGWATAGRRVVYARDEYQHAPAGPENSSDVHNAIDTIDDNLGLAASAHPELNQARLLDAYVGLNLANWQLSYGQESQWGGPGESGPLLFSDNAAPVRMFHIDRVSPFRLPWIGRFLGPMRWDAFFGRLQGNLLSPAPFFHGEKISFKPTPSLEFGFTRTVEVGGEGRPFTLDRLLLTYFSTTSYEVKPGAKDPGKRDGGFDFSHRVPYLRK
jgi:hypothetical protein